MMTVKGIKELCNTDNGTFAYQLGKNIVVCNLTSILWNETITSDGTRLIGGILSNIHCKSKRHFSVHIFITDRKYLECTCRFIHDLYDDYTDLPKVVIHVPLAAGPLLRDIKRKFDFGKTSPYLRIPKFILELNDVTFTSPYIRNKASLTVAYQYPGMIIPRTNLPKVQVSPVELAYDDDDLEVE